MTQGAEARFLAEPIHHLDLSDFCIVTGDTSIRETVERMRGGNHNCAFIVGEKTHLDGILTDRDVMRKVVGSPAIWDDPVSSIMTQNPRTIAPDASTQDALRLMDEGGFRNAPVVNPNGAIVGNITHFAILELLADHFPEAVYNLPPDPENYADSRVGG